MSGLNDTPDAQAKVITAAVVPANGPPRSLIKKKEPPAVVTEIQVQEPQTLARLLQRLLRDVAELLRRPAPSRLDFEDRAVTGTGTVVYRFPHNFNGRVRWWVTDSRGAVPALFCDVAATTKDMLALRSTSACTVTIRIEEVGG